MQYPSLHALYPKHSPIGWTVISYLGLGAILLWPLWTGNQLVGMLTVDMADTLYFQRSSFEYWFGNQAEAIGIRNETLWMWLPNWMDHLTMLPLMGLPFSVVCEPLVSFHVGKWWTGCTYLWLKDVVLPYPMPSCVGSLGYSVSPF